MVQDEPGGRADAAAHFPGDHVRDGGLAQAGRAVEDGVVQGFAAALGRLDADPQRFFHALLAGVVLQGLRAQGAFGVLFFFQEVVGDDAVFHEGGPVVGYGLGTARGRLPGVSDGPTPRSGSHSLP